MMRVASSCQGIDRQVPTQGQGKYYGGNKINSAVSGCSSGTKVRPIGLIQTRADTRNRLVPLQFVSTTNSDYNGQLRSQ